jgi:tetratricopeptide (TPR) repeat protein
MAETVPPPIPPPIPPPVPPPVPPATPRVVPPALPPSELRLDREHPWPGLISFTEADHAFFFGREREVAELARVIRQKTVTVFFGKSGLGKSSILRAGVSPLLRQSEFVPVYIRLNHDEAAPPLEDQVEIAIEEVLAREKIEAAKPVRSETLWEYFHKKESDWWDPDNRLVKPALIFDQFEELLTLGQSTPGRSARTAAFLTELEDLVENRPPAALQERFEAERGLARNYDLERVDYRVVLTLREDFLPDLEGLRERLRAIMFNRVRLLPMSGEQAMDVVLKPGGHLVDEDVAVRIVDFVSSSERSRLQTGVTRAQLAKRSVEPALLSVVLQELNNRRIRLRQEKITAELVGQTNPTEIFHDFYLRGLQGMDGQVRDFIEDCLLTSSGARNRIAEEDALTKQGISSGVISTLIDRRIIQRETTGNTKWLELTHDTLADVVRTDRAQHQQERQLQLAAAREAEARRKLRRVQKLALAFAGLLVAALLALFYALEQKRKAQQAQGLTTRATDELALGILRNIEQNPRMRVDEKLFLAERLSGTVQHLRSTAGRSNDLSLRLADLCATASLMLFDCGRVDEATEYADKAQSLISPPFRMPGNTGLVVARVQLAAGLKQRYAWQLDEALKLFDRADSELQKVSSASDQKHTAAVLKARLAAARADTLNYKSRYNDADKLTVAAIAEAERELVSVNEEPVWRSIGEELLRLHNWQYRNAKIGNLVDRFASIHDTFEAALKKCKEHFLNGDDPVWKYYEAKAIQARAVFEQHNESQDEAVQSARLGLEKLHALLLNDPQNIWLRSEVGSALGLRNELAVASGDQEQAKFDRDAIHKIAMTILRDQKTPYFSFLLAGFADLALNTPAGAASYLARVDLYAKRQPSNDSFLKLKLEAHRRCMTLMLQKSLYPPAIRQAEAALALLARFDGHGIEGADAKDWRINILGELLRVDADKLGRTRWNTFYDAAQAALTGEEVNTGPHLRNASWITSMRGDQYLRDKQYNEAIKTFQQCADACLAALEKGEDQQQELQNYLYMQSKIIAADTALGDWQQVAEIAEAARSKVASMVKAQPKLAKVLPYVDNTASAMEAANTALGDQKAGANATKIAEQLSREAAAMKDLAEELKRLDSTKSNSSSAASRIDLQRFELNDLKTGIAGNYWLVKQRLGWADPPIYPGQWRTLSATEFDETASHLVLPEGVSTDQIERIRTTPLSFYQDGRLIEAEYVGPKGYTYTTSILSAHGKAYLLNGTSPPIHNANAEAPLQLTRAEDAVAYLRFFSSYVRGEEGAFQIVENAGDLPWAAWAPPELKANVERLLRPLVAWPDPDALYAWQAIATIQYSNALFHAVLKIQRGGMVEMKEDQPVAADMPFDAVVYKAGGRAGKLEMLDLRTIVPPNDDTEVEARLTIAESKAMRPANYLTIADEAVELQSAITSILDDQGARGTLKNVLQRTYSLHKDAGDQSGADKYRQKMEELKNSADLLTDSWRQLLARDFAGALATTERGLKADPNDLPLQTNRAHALLFLGRANEAEAVYRKYLGQKIGSQTWEEVILDDFDKLEKDGVTSPEFNRIRQILKKGGH